MLSNFDRINPISSKFPKQGNVWGSYDGQPLLVPESHRAVRPLAVYGDSANAKQWLLSQMKQDIDAGRGVLCFDPANHLADELAATLANDQVKRVIWWDLDNDARPIPLNPFPSGAHGDEETWHEWRETLFGLLSPLPPHVASCVVFTLTTFRYSQSSHHSLQPCWLTFWRFISNDDYRRYLLSTVPVAFLNRLPSNNDFADVQKVLAPKLKPLFADNHTQALIAGWENSILTGKNLLDHDCANKIHIVTGGFDQLPNIAKASWQFAFFQMLGQSLDHTVHPFHAYDLGGTVFNTVALDKLVGKKPCPISLTMAPDFADGSEQGQRFEAWDTVTVDPEAPGLKVSLAAAIQGTNGFDLQLTLPTPKRNEHIARICRKYSDHKYGREIDLNLATQGAAIGNKNPDDQSTFYGSLGIKPRFLGKTQ